MGYLCPCFTLKSEWGTVGVVQVLSHSLLLANFDHTETEDYTSAPVKIMLDCVPLLCSMTHVYQWEIWKNTAGRSAYFKMVCERSQEEKRKSHHILDSLIENLGNCRLWPIPHICHWHHRHVCVKFSVRCKFFQIEWKKCIYLTFLETFLMFLVPVVVFFLV